MTLILAMGNPEYTVVGSDRRLSHNGALVDDESNKAALVLTDDARMVVTFTGLAIAGAFRTSSWIVDAVSSLAPPEHLALPLIERFASAAKDELARVPIPPDEKRLAVTFNGYRYFQDEPHHVLAVKVANFEYGGPTEQRFSVSVVHDESNAHYVLVAGSTRAVDSEDGQKLLKMVQDHEPAHVLVHNAVETIRAAADARHAHGTIGKQVSTVVLPADATQGASGAYHSAAASPYSYAVDFVDARSPRAGGGLSIRDVSVQGVDASGQSQFISHPQPGRNDRCWCGSGKKYKHCHGR